MNEAGEYAKILEFLERVEAATTREEFCNVVIAEVVRLVPADAGVSCHIAGTAGTFALEGTYGPQVKEAFNGYFRNRAPVPYTQLAAFRQTDWHEHENHEFVAELLRPIGIGNTCMVYHDGFHVSLTRTARRMTFTPIEIHRLELIAPHLALLYKRFDSPAPKPISDIELSSGWNPLTRREIEILERTRLRMTSKEIALDLGISCRTVDRHFENMFIKFDTHSRYELLKLL